MTTEEKKPIKGEELLKQVGKRLISQGQTQSSSNEEDENYYDKQIRRTRARRELEEEEKRLKDMDKPPETPFQIRGGINIGEIDLQEQQRRREQEQDADRQATAQRAQEMETENKQLQNQLYQEKIESLRRDFSEKMETLQKTIQSGGSQKSFMEQWTEMQTMAKEMGLEKTSTGQDPMIQLELAKMNYQQAKEDREFKWQMKQDDKKWQLEMQKLQDDREFRHIELNQQAKKDEMFASLPQTIGGAISKGLIDGQGEGEADHPITRQGKSYHIEIGEGESGDIICNNCDTPVGVGPTTTKAVCAGCNRIFNVTRKPVSRTEEFAESILDEEE